MLPYRNLIFSFAFFNYRKVASTNASRFVPRLFLQFFAEFLGALGALGNWGGWANIWNKTFIYVKKNYISCSSSLFRVS